MDALAAAYAENGRYDDAVFIAQKALKQDLNKAPKQFIHDLKQRLKLYQNKIPYRQTSSGERTVRYE